ncbi:unnamed protein product [Lactuca saligna]|uniref:Uncharacterized protein n=1 Tax=Lactuca saligna TaxID=75948 RepID=A0AA35YRR0_LACSI|nr:unnamed protein product [Lactuca saligna]
MLKKDDPSNPVLMAYLQTISPNEESGALLPRSGEGPSKKSRKPKKVDETTPEKPVQEAKVTKSQKKRWRGGQSFEEIKRAIETKMVEPTKEIVPSKIGVFKCLKNIAHRSRTSPERTSRFSPSMV